MNAIRGNGQLIAADRQWLTPFIWIAWLGVGTTAANTLIPVLAGALPDSSTVQSLRQARDPVLFVHAISTLLPMLALALCTFRLAPFAAICAAAFTSIEKTIELLGQTLALFPPEEIIDDVPAARITAAIWDQLFFTLWFCNTIGAAAAAWLMFKTRPSLLGKTFACAASLAALLTLLLLLGPDYIRLRVPSVPGWLFAVVFTAYRIAIALTLIALSRPREHLAAQSADASSRIE